MHKYNFSILIVSLILTPCNIYLEMSIILLSYILFYKQVSATEELIADSAMRMVTCLPILSPALPVEEELASLSRRVSAPAAPPANSVTATMPEDHLDFPEASRKAALTLATIASHSSAVSAIVALPADSATARPRTLEAAQVPLGRAQVLVSPSSKEPVTAETPASSLTLPTEELLLQETSEEEGTLRRASPSSAASANEAPPAGSATPRAIASPESR